MAAVKSGDRVQIVTRPVTFDDGKSGLYYEYFGGLVGTADRVYDDDSVCVDIDIESLSQDNRDRHMQMQDNERKRWLDSLSDEARNRLTAAQKQLKISYKILVSKNDLEPHTGGAPKLAGKSAEGETSESSSDARKGEPRAPGPAASAVKAEVDEPAPKRVSSADLEAAEEAYLREHHS